MYYMYYTENMKRKIYLSLFYVFLISYFVVYNIHTPVTVYLLRSSPFDCEYLRDVYTTVFNSSSVKYDIGGI